MDNLAAIFIVGFIVFGIYKLFELYAKRNERILMIEKLAHLCENEEDDNKQLKIKLPFLSGNSDFGLWPLRISLLLIGIGIGCLLAFYIQFAGFANFSLESYRECYRSFGDVIALINFACISIFGGIGLLTAFLIEQKIKGKNKKEN